MSKLKLTDLISKFIYFCSLIILCFLFLISIFSTCTVGPDINGESTVFYHQDYPLLHFIFISLFLFFIYRVKCKKIVKTIYPKILKTVIILWGIVASVWVLLYLNEPVHDSKHVLDAAAQMREYNFTSFTEGNYLNLWAGNRNFTLLLYLLSFLIGINNLTLLRVFNVLALLIIFWLLYKITKLFWQINESTCTLQMISCVIFIPALLYTIFIYGDIYGLAFAVGAIYLEFQYLSTHKLKWALLSSVMISLAALLKMNEIIILIAMSAMMLYDIILTTQWKKGILCLLMFIAMPICFNAGSNTLLEKTTRMEMTDGVPMEAWIAMGLQDSENAAGHYNGYNLSVYNRNNFDSEKAKVEVRENIKESLTNFKNNPQAAFSFFLRKITAQWCNPDFESLRYVQTGQNNLSSIVNGVLSGKAVSLVQQFLNLLQTWILLGAICYILLRKDKTEYEWIFMLIFVGGFSFHLFWEAGSRYAFPYYIMLLPYSCMGMNSLGAHAVSFIQTKEWQKPKNKYVATAFGVCLILISLLPTSPLFRAIGLVNEKDGLVTDANLKNGFYQIKASCEDELYLTEKQGNILIIRDDTSHQLCSLYCNPTTYIIRFQPSQNVLDLALDGSVYSSDNNYPFEWKIQKINTNQFYILVNEETALAYSLEDWSVKLVPFEAGNQEQIWEIVPR